MVEAVLAVFFIFIFLTVFVWLAIGAYHVLKFLLPLMLRLLIFMLFRVSVIKPGVLKSFYGSYFITYLRWDDENGKTHSTKDKGVRIKRMYYGFKDGMVYSDFNLELEDGEVWSESAFGKVFDNADCYCEVRGWFTVYCRGRTKYPNGRTAPFEISMMKFSNRVVKRCFRCLKEEAPPA